ncbi:hypothetical protein P170DRAFT_176899 [Aspergillus steynii IBT 23096]|uniref:Uncharacterized protein n=1 Tax=Aspergillus steynii IBT 23096 TaxID=1392250 RepID=A0A2I2G8G5_9EURO|nr:uncharacterized protein P170DRAFT_176899 [Aspergillus steynii IBT 23096]PLB49165.1 hypothetical protein P170DRAFT_176899 [Aspergillus steynii IBT 23096]
MQHRSELHDNLVAPGPIVPTCRPSSQLSRRAYRSMSALSSGDPQRPETPDSRMRGENVPELVQLFQAQNSSPNGNIQASGARDFLKAGHRRLRQLAQRQKKPVDPKVKAEEASKQLLALQNAGFLPPPRPKRSEAKQSLDSTVSSSNLSFKSSSRRDVERIGQPWLDDPLEKMDTRGTKDSQLSSIDIRDLTSLVEASVSFSHHEDGNFPPYQPMIESSSIAGDEYTHKQYDAGGPGLQNKMLENGELQKHETEAPPKTPSTEQAAGSDSKASSVAPDAGASDDSRQQSSTEQTRDSKPAECKDAPVKSARNSTSSSVSTSSQTPAHTLKLFPDPMPPRVSSKGAWRISNGRPPNRPLPVTPENREIRPEDKPSTAKSGGDNQKLSSNNTPITKSYNNDSSGSSPDSLALPHNLTELSAASPIHEKFPRPLTNRRPASLPLGAINAFPLPAPMRPLPSLPEPVPGIHAGRDKKKASGNRTSQTKSNNSDPRSSGEISGTSSKETGVYPDALSGAKENKDPAAIMQNGASKTSPSKHSDSKEVVITGPSRAERVRALKMKDMSASRLYLKGGEKASKEDQSSKSSRSHTESSQPASGGSIDSRLSEANSLSPPLSPLLSKPLSFPVSKHISGKRSCSSPVYSSGSDKPTSLPGSNRDSRVSRSSSAQSADVIHEDLPIGQSPPDRAESPLPSSEDECIGVSSHKDHQSRPHPSHRQTRPAPLSIGDHATQRARHSKKLLHESIGPSTPRTRRSRGVEKLSPQSQFSQSTFYSQDSRGSRHRAYALNLEGRIAHLERQNTILQAALLAALDVGVKPNLEALLGGSSTSSASGTGRTYSSTTNSSSVEELPRRSKTKEQSCYRQESWIASPGSSRRDSYGSSDDSTNVRELEDMIEDFDFDWILDKDKPGSERHPLGRN